MLAAGIVLFNPDISFVRKNIYCLLEDVDLVILVDNSESDYSNYFDNLSNRVIYTANMLNQGVASALNQIMQKAADLDIDWVLTLDQDSVPSSNMASRLLACIPPGLKQDIAIICPSFIDINSKKLDSDSGLVKYCITSGALTSVEAWSQTSGFDNWLFIDYVDYDFCEKLALAGWKIFRTEEVCMQHSIGFTTYNKFLGHNFKNMNHTAFRKYYQSRNRPYFLWKYGNYSLFEILFHALSAIFKVILFEEDKENKVKAIVRGTFVGINKVNCLKRDPSATLN